MTKRLAGRCDLPMTRAVQQRVIYADTDRMGVVYHATYLRYLESARVEFMRGMGFAYAEMERMGYGLPVIDLAVTYLASAVYDDIVSVWVAMARLSPARINFAYRLTIEPGDRHGFTGVQRESGESGESGGALELIRAETRHGCVSLADGRAARIPDPIFDKLERHSSSQAGE